MRRRRRGSALVLVLLMTLAVAALAIAAIFMTSSAGLLSRFYDKERLYGLAAESAIEYARSRLTNDLALTIPDTGMVQLMSGWTPTDADGGAIGNVSVNLYAAVTGDTTGLYRPYVTLIAASYDASGTRQVRRLDLERESFSRYQLFVDSFPVSDAHGPGTVAGRVHSNMAWRSSSSTANVYLDTVSAVDSLVGTDSLEVPALTGVVPAPYPRDSTYAWMTTYANAAGLAITPVSGSGRGSHLEFVSFDADNDGTVETHEGFFRVFDIASGFDTTYVRASPNTSYWAGSLHYQWSDPQIQNQCGAFYYRAGRWHFFPIITHRRTWAQAVIEQSGSNIWPDVSASMMNRLEDYDFDAVEEILELPTARCFPAGSPYLMTAERFTNTSGVVTGTDADSIPFGEIVPVGGWPTSAPSGYGGSDSTFTPTSRTCALAMDGGTGTNCTDSLRTLGSWQTGTGPSGISTSVRQATEHPYLFAISPTYNTNSRRVVAVAGSIYVSGSVAGAVTLFGSDQVVQIDGLRYAHDPNDDTQDACNHSLGIVAVGDVLVASGLMTRVRRIGRQYTAGMTQALESFGEHLGGEPRVTTMGALMSLTGTVGVEGASSTMGDATWQIECPELASGTSTRSNGGCWAHTGGAVMYHYSPLYSATNYGMRYRGTPDRCASTSRRPPFFPLTNRYTEVRSIEVEASEANNPTKIRALLMRLKGKR